MATNKYASLPDIDTQPDTYETEEPKTMQIRIPKTASSKETNETNPNIATNSINILEATQNILEKDEYLEKIILNEDELIKKNNKALAYEYLTKNYSGSLEVETDYMKIKRILAELKLLENRLETDNKTKERDLSEQTIDNVQKIANKIYEQLKTNKKLNNEAGEEEKNNDYEEELDKEIKFEQLNSKQSLDELLKFESRLSNIERLLGGEKLNYKEGVNITKKIEKIYEYLEIILNNKNKLEIINEKTNIINEKMEKIIKTETKIQTHDSTEQEEEINVEFYRKINGMYELCTNKLASLINVAPTVIDRLVEMSAINHKIKDQANLNEKVANSYDNILNCIKEYNSKITMLQQTLLENKELAVQNVAHLDQKIEHLNHMVVELRNNVEVDH